MGWVSVGHGGSGGLEEEEGESGKQAAAGGDDDGVEERGLAEGRSRSPSPGPQLGLELSMGSIED